MQFSIALRRFALAYTVTILTMAGVSAQPGPALQKPRPTVRNIIESGTTCRLYAFLKSSLIEGLQVDGRWRLENVSDSPKNPLHEYRGRLVDASGRVRQVRIEVLKRDWDCRPEAERQSAAAFRLQSEDSDRKRLACRHDPRSLIGLSREALRAECGIWADVNRTITAGGSFEQIIYGFRVEGGPFLYIYLENGVVTSVQDR